MNQLTKSKTLSLRGLVLALFILLVVLQTTLWTGHGGIPSARKIEAQALRQSEENLALKQRNDALAAEVSDLKQGNDAIEEHARGELGMVKPGETFYQVIESKIEPKEASQSDSTGLNAGDDLSSESATAFPAQ